ADTTHFPYRRSSDLQPCQMSTAIQSFANITGQCTDISALAAHYPDFNLRQITFQQLYLIYNQRLGFQHHILTFSTQIVSAYTIRSEEHTSELQSRYD